MANGVAIVTELAPGVVLVEVRPDDPAGYSIVLTLDGGP